MSALDASHGADVPASAQAGARAAQAAQVANIAARLERLERALRAAGSVSSGTGDVAERHDDVLSGERW